MSRPPLAQEPFDAWITHLRKRLAGPLPGAAAQLGMAPLYRRDPALLSVEGKACREAGVLVLLFPLDGVPALLLTVRHADLAHHAGQVSFPGGRREPGETVLETALREAAEEVGLDPAAVVVAGPLTPLYVPPSGFCVYPYVAAVPFAPALHPRTGEVDAVLRVPLPHLLDPATRRSAPRTLNGQEVMVPYLDVDGYQVWGATAMMLAELLSLFDGPGA